MKKEEKKTENKETVSKKEEKKETKIDKQIDIKSKEDLPKVEESGVKEVKKEIRRSRERIFDKESWQPKTTIGKKVKNNEITDINEILDSSIKILEPGITDVLIQDLEMDLLLIGQAKGKFGGGQKRIFKQTQKKTREGNKPKFTTCAIVGNKNGFIGVGYGSSKETVPAREKAIRNAKIGIIKIKRGCGSWECNCKEPHSIPFKISGKCSSAFIELLPAPKGTGLVVEKEVGKILSIAGIKDVWSRTKGQTKQKKNLINACLNAFKMLNDVKVQQRFNKDLGIVEGAIKIEETPKIEKPIPESTQQKEDSKESNKTEGVVKKK